LQTSSQHPFLTQERNPRGSLVAHKMLTG
jgi:hypothetical protein